MPPRRGCAHFRRALTAFRIDLRSQMQPKAGIAEGTDYEDFDVRSSTTAAAAAAPSAAPRAAPAGQKSTKEEVDAATATALQAQMGNLMARLPPRSFLISLRLESSGPAGYTTLFVPEVEDFGPSAASLLA